MVKASRHIRLCTCLRHTVFYYHDDRLRYPELPRQKQAHMKTKPFKKIMGIVTEQSLPPGVQNSCGVREGGRTGSFDSVRAATAADDDEVSRPISHSLCGGAPVGDRPRNTVAACRSPGRRTFLGTVGRIGNQDRLGSEE